MKNLNHFLNEKTVGNIKKTITISLDIDATKHALERQTRHGSDKYNIIEMDEVTDIVDSATPRLINDLIQNNINVEEDSIILQDKYTETTVVGILKKKSNTEIKFLIITLYRGKDFRIGRDQKVIEV
jgi:hypothetical protein